MIRAYNKAFVKIKYMLPCIGVAYSDFHGWLEITDVPYTLIKNKDIFVEKLAFGEIIRAHGNEKNFKKWLMEIRSENISRSLSKTDKIRVAANQQWKCARCKKILPATFEVDHVEEWCLRHSDKLLQALCPGCHREKSFDDINVGNAYFGKASVVNLKCDETNRINFENNRKQEQKKQEESEKNNNVFSKYFHH